MPSATVQDMTQNQSPRTVVKMNELLSLKMNLSLLPSASPSTPPPLSRPVSLCYCLSLPISFCPFVSHFSVPLCLPTSLYVCLSTSGFLPAPVYVFLSLSRSDFISVCLSVSDPHSLCSPHSLTYPICPLRTQPMVTTRSEESV